MTLKQEALQATKLLKGKAIARIWRHRKKEVVIECTDGTRFFIDYASDRLNLSIT